MKYIILLAAILLVGCTPVDAMNTAKAEYLCKDSGGLHRIMTFSEYPVICNNGQVFSTQQLQLVIIDDPKYYAEPLY